MFSVLDRSGHCDSYKLIPWKIFTTNTIQVGYVIAGLRSTRQARIGDTMFIPSEWSSSQASQLVALPGYEAAKPMLFASIYPVDAEDLDALFAAVDKLCLNDSSISITKDQSSSLGSESFIFARSCCRIFSRFRAGLRCGFLGFLHMEVFNQRLKDEFNMDIVMTTPSVPYIIEYHSDKMKGTESRREKISCVSEWPATANAKSSTAYFTIMEPMVKVGKVFFEMF